MTQARNDGSGPSVPEGHDRAVAGNSSSRLSPVRENRIAIPFHYAELMRLIEGLECSLGYTFPYSESRKRKQTTSMMVNKS